MSDAPMFLLKADIRVPDEILQTLTRCREEQSQRNLPLIDKISQHLFGTLPNKCEPVLEGTFHLIYKLHYADKKIILKIGLELPEYIHPKLSQSILLHRVLHHRGIPVPVLYTAPYFNHHDFQYVAMEFIDGLSYEQCAYSSHSYDSIVEQLGYQLAAVHKIEVTGFGAIQTPSSETSVFIKAKMPNWVDFIQSCLADHLTLCKKNNYLSSADCDNSRSIFKELASTLNHSKSRLLHGDLGPKNILVKSDHSLCLIDWEDALGGDKRFDSWLLPACSCSRRFLLKVFFISVPYFIS